MFVRVKKIGAYEYLYLVAPVQSVSGAAAARLLPIDATTREQRKLWWPQLAG